MIGWLRGPWLAVAATALLGLFVAGRARADEPPQLTVRASADQVEVGEAFTIELKAMVAQGTTAPSDPAIRPPAGFAVEGPSLSTQTIINGFGSRAQVRVGIGATWSLTAQKPGRYTIPAPTVMWNGKRLAGAPVPIEVLAASGRRRARPPQNPFLLPGGPGFGFRWPFQDEPRDDDEINAAPELAMAKAPDPLVFVRAVVDKPSAVVGEQVTLSIYVYWRADIQAQMPAFHEAPLSDFVRIPLLRNPGTERPVVTTVGGKKYVAKLFDRVAIFPMRAGDLHTGSMRMTFTGPRLGRGSDRESPDQIIRVSEPPRAGRPPGYAIGDVGQISLAASVQPRRIDQGGSVAVSIKLAGTGNLPQSVRLPERTGIEWLDPEKKDAIESQNGVVGGSRTLGYVVRVNESGAVDLGEVTLPYWDPIAKSYQVARATLGTVDVKPVSPIAAPGASSGASPIAEPARVDPFVSLPHARATLGAYTPRARRFEGGSTLWLLIAAPPLLVGLTSLGAGAARRARARRAEAAGSPGALVSKALDDARDAEARGDIKALTAAIDRAVHLAIEAACGLRSRGVLLAELRGELEGRGLSRALGDRVTSVLGDCDAVRFEPAPDAARTKEIAARARAVVAELARHEAK